MPRPADSAASVRYHNRVARQYDAMYDDPYWHFHDEVTWRHVRPHLPRDANARCLDLGCGTGKWGLKLAKSGYAVTFADHSPAMVGETRGKIDAFVAERPTRAGTLDAVVADLVDLSALPADAYALTLAMGDPLSICSDAKRAAREMFRVCAPGGVVVASADNQLAALPHFAKAGDLDGLEAFARTGRTHWLTADARERFETTTFTPGTLRRLFERAGFDVLSVVGKTVLPVRDHKSLLVDPSAVRRLVAMEMKLSADESSAAAAGHLQVAARKPA